MVICITYGDPTVSVSAVIQAIQSWCGLSLPFGRYTATWASILSAQNSRTPVVMNTF